MNALTSAEPSPQVSLGNYRMATDMKIIADYTWL